MGILWEFFWEFFGNSFGNSLGILLGILWESLLEVTNEELSGVAAELLKTVDFYFIKPMNFDLTTNVKTVEVFIVHC